MERTIKFTTTDREEAGLKFALGHPTVEGQTAEDLMVESVRRTLEDFASQAESDIRSRRKDAIESLNDLQQTRLTAVLMKLPEASDEQRQVVMSHVAAIAEVIGVSFTE